jgi:HEAT repeat protein/nucleoside phosphorylase
MKLWKSRIKHKRCIVIIDGLNEIERQFRNKSAWRFVKSTVEGGHPFPVLATMRHFADEPQQSLIRPVHMLNLAPLTDSQIMTYLEAKGLDRMDVLRLRSQDGDEDLYSNPLLLSLTANILAPRSDDRTAMAMPTCRGRLFLQTVQRARHNRRLSSAEVTIERGGLQLESVMVAAASCALCSPGRDQEFSRRDVERLLAEYWSDAAELAAIIDAFLDTQMVVRVADRGPAERFRFAHPSFVDFGVALAYREEELPAALRVSEELVHCLGDWVGLTANPDEAARSLLPKNLQENKDFELDRSHLVDVVFANRAVLNPETRIQLWNAIGAAFGSAQKGQRWEQESVIQALNQLPEWTVAEGIDMGLLDWVPNSLGSVIDQLLASRSLDVRHVRRAQRQMRNERASIVNVERQRSYALAQQLGAVGTNRTDALRVLKSSLRTADPKLSELIMKAILRIGGIDEWPFCVSALSSDPMESTRAAAATALALVGRGDVIKQLMDSLANDDSSLVRVACARTLGKLGARAAVGVLSGALSDQSKVMRISAARALGMIASRQALTPLIRALNTEHDYQALASIAWALGELRDAAAVPGLVMALTETSMGVRAEASRALGMIGDRAAVPALARRLTDSVGLVRGQALKALGHIGDASATPYLINALAHSDARTRTMAARSLAQIGDPRAVDPLMQTLDDENSFVRAAAALSLGRFSNGHIAVRLDQIATHDSDAAVRSSAINSLGRMGSSRDLRMLERIIRDSTDDYWVRAVAVKAYGALTQETPMWLANIADSLKQAIRGGHSEANKLRGAIVYCVGQHCNIELINWLESVARSDPNVITRSAAAAGLAQNGRTSERFLNMLLSDGERAVAAGDRLDEIVLTIAATEIVRISAESSEAELTTLARLLDLVLGEPQKSLGIVLGAIKNNRRSESRPMVRVLEYINDRLAMAAPDHPNRSTIESAIAFHRQQIAFEQVLARLHSDAGFLTARFQASLEGMQPRAEGKLRVDESCDLLVITVNAIETEIARRALSDLCGPPVLEHAAINSYWRYSRDDFVSVKHLRCGMGGSGVRGAYVQIGDAIRDVRPVSVVAVGVAWGRDAAKTPVGTVLLSTLILDFERQRIGEDSTGERIVIARGARTEASPRLVNRFLTADYSATSVSIADGPLLSGEKLIDNSVFKQQVIEMFPEAIGGEMEGIGIQSVCDRAGVDWIVVKGVCDFAENKSEDKANRQALAAARSVEALCTVLSQGGFSSTT